MAMKQRVKVEYDVGKKMEKEAEKKAKREAKRSRRKSDRILEDEPKLSKGNIGLLIALLIVSAGFYYLVTPPINVRVGGFYWWLAFETGIAAFFSMDTNSVGKIPRFTKFAKVMFTICLLSIGTVFIGGLASSPLFNAKKYANVIEVETGDFVTDVPESENISNIALMDTDSAKIIGNRAIGSLADVVSQYEVSESYSTIDFNGVPMKVAPLEYAGFFKYMNNKADGIPGYVLVDPVKNEAKYVKLDKAIQYCESAYFGHNIRRHVQMSYPTYNFNGFYFEIDNDGNPYYICPVLTPNAGLLGAKDVKGIVICDPCTGDCNYYSKGEIPNWVDRVYDGDLACQKYNWYGELSGGFWNSIIGNKGCKVTTDDYGYKIMDGDVWVYTGVTSVNGDQSNIGFVLMNSRTGDSKYFAIAGAEEHSAMSSAEGQVQNLGYTASFPSLININGVPTYIMVLKDNAGLVKMYALVNVEKYNIVATGTTQKDALAGYRKLLAENGIAMSESAQEDIPSKIITVKDIRYITVEEETFVYITDKNGIVYKQAFAEDETLILIQPEDKITVYYMESENGINSLIRYEK